MAVILNAHTFRSAIEGFLSGPVTVKGSSLRQAIATDALEHLIKYTPVDTGRARGNWVVSPGEPSKEFNEDTKDKTGGETWAKGAQIIQQQRWRHIRTGIFTANLYISNHTPYIDDLNDGHPTKGAFKPRNAGLGFMTDRTQAYITARYAGR